MFSLTGIKRCCTSRDQARTPWIPKYTTLNLNRNLFKTMEIFLHWPLWNVQKSYLLTFCLPKTPQIPFCNIWITLPKESITRKDSRSNSKCGKRYSFKTRINLESKQTTDDKTDTFQIMYHVWKLCKAWTKNISPFPTETRKGGNQRKHHPIHA